MAGVGGRAGGRVVLFPLPFQGHLNPMLQLAGALHAHGFAITVLHTTYNAPDPAGHPEFAFVAVPDGMPGSVAASKDAIAKILAINSAMEASGCVRDALASVLSEEPRAACLLIDSLLPAVRKATVQLGLPTLVLHTGSAACVRLFRSYPMLYDKGYLPAQESELHMPVKELPPLRVSDLFDPSKHCNQEMANRILNLSIETTTNSSGIVINTFEALEAPEVEAIRDELATDGIGVFAVGPLHKLSSSDAAASSLLGQDRSCIEWLDTQASGSVLYVSFGSVVTVNRDEFREVAWGLASSGKPFLWVVRQGLVIGAEKAELPDGFERAVEGRGKWRVWLPARITPSRPRGPGSRETLSYFVPLEPGCALPAALYGPDLPLDADNQSASHCIPQARPAGIQPTKRAQGDRVGTAGGGASPPRRGRVLDAQWVELDAGEHIRGSSDAVNAPHWGSTGDGEVRGGSVADRVYAGGQAREREDRDGDEEVDGRGGDEGESEGS